MAQVENEVDDRGQRAALPKPQLGRPNLDTVERVPKVLLEDTFLTQDRRMVAIEAAVRHDGLLGGQLLPEPLPARTVTVLGRPGLAMEDGSLRIVRVVQEVLQTLPDRLKESIRTRCAASLLSRLTMVLLTLTFLDGRASGRSSPSSGRLDGRGVAGDGEVDESFACLAS